MGNHGDRDKGRNVTRNIAVFRTKTFSLPRIKQLSTHVTTVVNIVIPLHYCIRPVRLKFELTNQDSAGGKNCTILTSNAASIHESQGIYSSTNHIRLKNPHLTSIILYFYFLFFVICQEKDYYHVVSVAIGQVCFVGYCQYSLSRQAA